MKINLKSTKLEAKKGLFTVLTAMLMFALTVPATVGAIEATTANEQTTTQTAARTQAETSTNQSSANINEEKSSIGVIKARLTADKLELCQKRETEITNIMARVGDRGQKQLDLFAGIATKAENFYAEKAKTLSNYDALVTDVNNQKSAAQLAVDTVKSTAPSFKCDSDNPKATVASFKEVAKIEITALNTYKQSVKNLIVGIKSVQSTTTGGNQ